LATLSVQWMTGQPRDSFVFRWDGLGRRDSIRYVQPGVSVSFGYDRDGHLRMVCSRHSANNSVTDQLEHRLWYKSLNADGNPLNLDHRVGGTTSPGCSNIPSGAVSGPLFGLFKYDTRHQATNDGIYRYTYDASGNRLTKRQQDFGLLESQVYLSATSNRLKQLYDATPTLVKTYTDHANGARRMEEPPSANGNWRLYYYNALGQMRGSASGCGAGGCSSGPGRAIAAGTTRWDGGSWGAARRWRGGSGSMGRT
jgi:YD repeat-containing protein